MSKLKSIFRGKTWGGSLIRVLLLLTICTVPFWYHYKPVWIDGISMIPTYEDGQWTLMQRTRSFNDAWRPDRFDVIAVWSEKDDVILCKRVLGLPGETVEVKEGRIFIDGSDLHDSFSRGKMIYRQLIDPSTDEPWWTEYENIAPVIVQPGHIWVIGDNREDSIFGHFPIKEVHGKIVLY